MYSMLLIRSQTLEKPKVREFKSSKMKYTLKDKSSIMKIN